MIAEIVWDVISDAFIDYVTDSFCVLNKKIDELHYDFLLRLLVRPESELVGDAFQKALKHLNLLDILFNEIIFYSLSLLSLQ